MGWSAGDIIIIFNCVQHLFGCTENKCVDLYLQSVHKKRFLLLCLGSCFICCLLHSLLVRISFLFIELIVCCLLHSLFYYIWLFCICTCIHTQMRIIWSNVLFTNLLQTHIYIRGSCHVRYDLLYPCWNAAMI